MVVNIKPFLICIMLMLQLKILQQLHRFLVWLIAERVHHPEEQFVIAVDLSKFNYKRWLRNMATFLTNF